MSFAAFFGNVWSFILTLVRSLLAFFSYRRRSADPLVLPRVRTPRDALARAHTRLRPILLTPRSIALTRTRTRSATSTLLNNTGAPHRTSPKLAPHDVELGSASLPAAASVPEDTPNTSSQTTSLSVLPLTPPDRCYLVPMPSATDCPYAEPWPTNPGKPRLPGSPLKISFDNVPNPKVRPIGSPPPGRWSTVQIWTSTPCKEDDIVPDLALSSFAHSPKEPSSTLADISHALISRSRSSIQPYDDTSDSSPSSEASMFVNYSNGRNNAGVDPLRERHRSLAQAARFKNEPYLRFHHPDAYAWRRRAARVPGKPDRSPHAYTRSYSYMDMSPSEWYSSDAYVPSPISALSPPLGDSATEDEDEDEVPLGRLRDRIVRRSRAAGTTIALGVSLGAKAIISPRTRRMSDGCLLAISESTPTRVGMGSRSGRHVLSLALDGDGARDWLEALSLHFAPDQKGPLVVQTEVRDVDTV